MAQTLGAEVTAGSDPVPIKLFRGYDTVARGLLTASAVTGDFENSKVTSEVKVEVCESLTDLAKALEIDASLSVSYLKAADVTAKMEFARKLNVTARSVTIVVYAKHGIGTWDVKEVRLKDTREMKDPPKAPVDSASAAVFAKTYGDSFVRSVTLGGEYYAVYVFNTETREQQQSLATSLKGKVEGGAATVKADAQLKLTDFLNTTKTNWTLKQGMTGIVNPDFPDQNKLIPFALGFSKLELDGPVAIDVKVTGYEDVAGFAESFDKVVQNRDYFLHSKRGLLQKLARLTVLSNQADWLKGIYKRYQYEGDKALGGFSDRVDADIDAIDTQIAQWKSNTAGNFVAPNLPSLKEGEPVLNFQEASSPAWGGTTAAPWKLDSVGDLIRNRTRLKSIEIASAKYDIYLLLGRLIVEYDSDKRSWTETYGDKPVETAQPRIDLEEGQSPVRFELRFGTYLDWLRIHLSDGRTTDAGGPGGGGKADWAIPDGWFFVGFAGRSGGIIDQLQVRYAKLNPAKMVS
jgi:carbon monoxide dehydrogenase subunit G